MSNGPKFTPGPWHYTHEPNAKRARGKFLTVLPVGDTVPICDVNRHRGPSSEANAALIATAPAMFAALQRIADADHCARLSFLGGECPTCIARAALISVKGTP